MKQLVRKLKEMKCLFQNQKPVPYSDEKNNLLILACHLISKNYPNVSELLSSLKVPEPCLKKPVT